MDLAIGVGLGRRRTTREGVKRSRAAIELVRPWRSEISGWQSRVAYLAIEAKRARERGGDGQATQDRIGDLERTIVAARESLALRLADVPVELRAHAIVVDVDRSMTSALAALARARSMLRS